MNTDHVNPAAPHTEPPGAGHETSDLQLPAIIKFIIGFACFIIAGHVMMVLMFHYFEHEQRPPITPFSAPVVQVTPPVIGPRLDVNPTQNWDEWRDAQDRLLHSYGWINPQAGVVRIPIDRAIELTLQRGLPARAPAAQPAGTVTR